MGACMKKHVDTYKVINQLELGDTASVIKEIEFADVNPVGKDAKGRTPFNVACRKGQVEVVRHFLDGNHKDRITEDHMSQGLYINCQGHTSGEVVLELLSKKRNINANVHYFDPDTISTALHAAAARGPNTTSEQLAEKAYVIGVLCKGGANPGHENIKTQTALDVAMTSEFERAGSEIILGGGDLMHVTRYMKQSRDNGQNWVANSMLSKFAFKHPLYLKKIKKQFHDEFDPDGSGELDRKELLRFIAFHVKLGFKNGQKPVKEFNDDDGSLEISDVMRLLETRCQSYLKQFHVLDEDQSGTFGWEELLPIIRKFYQEMWQATRKEDCGKDEWLDAKAEQALKAKFQNIRDSVRPRSKQDAVSALDLKRGQQAKTLKGKIKGPKQSVAIVHKQVRTSGPVAHDLPEGWVAHVDPKSGKQYYHNTKTGATVWKKPKF
jgi:Ca2+-binding EF-hand superfamily protein|eukprot:Stramenopile-MAST_4_protein_482